MTLSYKKSTTLNSKEEFYFQTSIEKEIYSYCRYKYNFNAFNILLNIIMSDLRVYIKSDIEINIEITAPCLNGTLQVIISSPDTFKIDDLYKNLFPLKFSLSSKHLSTFNLQMTLDNVYSTINLYSELDSTLAVIKILKFIDVAFNFGNELNLIFPKFELSSNIHILNFREFKIEITRSFFLFKSDVKDFIFKIELDILLDNEIKIIIDESSIKFPLSRFTSINQEDFNSLIENIIKISSYDCKSIQSFYEKIQLKFIVDY